MEEQIRNDQIYKSLPLVDFMNQCAFVMSKAGFYAGGIISDFNYEKQLKINKEKTDAELKEMFFTSLLKSVEKLPHNTIKIYFHDCGTYYDVWSSNHGAKMFSPAFTTGFVQNLLEIAWLFDDMLHKKNFPKDNIRYQEKTYQMISHLAGNFKVSGKGNYLEELSQYTMPSLKTLLQEAGAAQISPYSPVYDSTANLLARLIIHLVWIEDELIHEEKIEDNDWIYEHSKELIVMSALMAIEKYSLIKVSFSDISMHNSLRDVFYEQYLNLKKHLRFCPH